MYSNDCSQSPFVRYSIRCLAHSDLRLLPDYSYRIPWSYCVQASPSCLLVSWPNKQSRLDERGATWNVLASCRPFAIRLVPLPSVWPRSCCFLMFHLLPQQVPVTGSNSVSEGDSLITVIALTAVLVAGQARHISQEQCCTGCS